MHLLTAGQLENAVELAEEIEVASMDMIQVEMTFASAQTLTAAVFAAAAAAVD